MGEPVIIYYVKILVILEGGEAYPFVDEGPGFDTKEQAEEFAKEVRQRTGLPTSVDSIPVMVNAL